MPTPQSSPAFDSRIQQYNIVRDGNGQPGVVPAFYSNFLKRFRRDQGRVRTGMQGGSAYRAIILEVGDSKTMGAGADGSAGNTAGAEPLSRPSHFCAHMTAKGLNNNRNTCFGYRGTGSPAAMTAYDPRIVFDPALAHSGILASLGGYYFRLSGLVTQAFTSTGTVDRGELYTRQSSGDGTMTVAATASGATVLATVDANGADAIVKTPFSFLSLAQHTMNMQRISGGFVYPIGFRLWNNALSGFDVINAGAYGTDSGFHADTSTAWTAIKMIPVLTNLSLVKIQLGSNDLGNGVPLATTLANIQALVTAAKSVGADVALLYPTYGPDDQFGTPAQREALRLGYAAIAARNGCVFIDHASRFGTYADAFANGFMGTSIHEIGAGYADEALFEASTLLV